VSVRGIAAVAGVEWSKLLAQLKVRLALAACVAGPFAFAVAMRVQSSLPTIYAVRAITTDSGFAIPLVVPGLPRLGLPVLPASFAATCFRPRIATAMDDGVDAVAQPRGSVRGKGADGAGLQPSQSRVGHQQRGRRHPHRRAAAPRQLVGLLLSPGQATVSLVFA
jgi:hypothetical protein